MNFDRELIAHCAGRNKERSLLFENGRRQFLEPVGGRILAVDIVTDLSPGHCFAHFIGRLSDRIASQIYLFHSIALPVCQNRANHIFPLRALISQNPLEYSNDSPSTRRMPPGRLEGHAGLPSFETGGIRANPLTVGLHPFSAQRWRRVALGWYNFRESCGTSRESQL